MAGTPLAVHGLSSQQPGPCAEAGWGALQDLPAAHALVGVAGVHLSGHIPPAPASLLRAAPAALAAIFLGTCRQFSIIMAQSQP